MWIGELRKIGCIVDNLEDNIIKLNMIHPLKPNYLKYNNFLIDVKDVQSKKFPIDINNVLLYIKRAPSNKIIVNDVLVDAHHPNASSITTTNIMYLKKSHDFKIINKFCINSFVFDDSDPTDFVNKINTLIGNLKIWNYDSAFWRDFKILDLDIDSKMDYIDPITNNIISGKRLIKRIKRHNKVIKLSAILNKYTVFDNNSFEHLVKKFI